MSHHHHHPQHQYPNAVSNAGRTTPPPPLSSSLQETYVLQHNHQLIDTVHPQLQYDNSNNITTTATTEHSTTPPQYPLPQQRGNDDPYSDDTDEYIDLNTARRNEFYYNHINNINNGNNGNIYEYDNHTVLTAANISHNNNNHMYDSDPNHHNNHNHHQNYDVTMAVHEMHLTLLYMMSHPVEFEKCLWASSPPQHTSSTTTTQPHSSGLPQHCAADDLSLCTETTDFSIQPPPLQQQQQQQAPPSTNTTTTTFTSMMEDGISHLMTSSRKPLHDPKSPNRATNRHHHHSILRPDDPNPMSEDDHNNTVLLPYLIFCDDAEIVLPQAHTASQLFGIELISGIELEAASGIVPICQLFLRWLALMPSGDHLHIIDPPGLTVMRIAGGRYRVTAAHRVVWTWMNEFVPLQHLISSSSSSSSPPQYHSTTTSIHATTTTTSGVSPIDSSNKATNNNTQALQMGDLVGMTIVDVFESDHSGKLLSYCPTFDNRNIYKMDRTTYQIKKHTTTAMKSVIQKVIQTSYIASAISQYTTNIATRVHQHVTHAVHQYQHPPPVTTPSTTTHSNDDSGGRPMINPAVTSVDKDDDGVEVEQDDEEEEDVITLATASSKPTPTLTSSSLSPHRTISKITSESTSVYHGDDDNERHEV